MKHWFRIYGIWNCATASLSQSGEADFPLASKVGVGGCDVADADADADDRG